MNFEPSADEFLSQRARELVSQLASVTILCSCSLTGIKVKKLS